MTDVSPAEAQMKKIELALKEFRGIALSDEQFLVARVRELEAENAVLRIPDVVYDGLTDTYTDKGCVIWWNSRNLNADRCRPRELWAAGERERSLVLELVDRLAGGPRG